MTKQENLEELNSLLRLGTLTGLSPQTLEAIKEATIAYEEQQESKWIPVSEKLPEESDTYIVTIQLYPESKPFTDCACYKIDNKQWEDRPYNEHSLISDITDEVTAWMPLPVHYTEIKKESLEQEPKMEDYKDFALWLADEIFDEMWEYNKDAFEELACRKLAKLGIVRANGGKWELVEPQETED